MVQVRMISIFFFAKSLSISGFMALTSPRLTA